MNHKEEASGSLRFGLFLLSENYEMPIPNLSNCHAELRMRSSVEIRHTESTALARGVENICRKLVKFLIGRISLVKLQEIIRFVYVEEVENKLRTENPSKNIPLTQFALLSGLDTRTLTKVRNDAKYRRPLYHESNFIEEITPGTSILDAWCSQPPYVNEETGKPRTLAISGKSNSFESLFNVATKSRGVTYKSLLKRLVESGAVSMDSKSQSVTLQSNTYLPASAKDKLGAIEVGFSALGNMVDTVTYNIVALEKGEERIYQRGAWAHRLNPHNISELKVQLKELLKSTDSKARQIIETHEDSFASSDQITAGISLFYFEQ
jgi:hypothetical protein